MKKTLFLSVIVLSLSGIYISSCSEEEISRIECEGSLKPKPLNELKYCISGKWKAVRSYNIYSEFEISIQYIEFKSDSFNIKYPDDNKTYHYPIEWVKYDTAYYNKEDAYYIKTITSFGYDFEINLLELVNDTLSISDFEVEGRTHKLVRVDNFTQ